MNIEPIVIYNEPIEIPAILWGENNNKLLIAVHGGQSNKNDTIIRILAENAIIKNYQVLSIGSGNIFICL